jgi:hypothetical protein
VSDWPWATPQATRAGLRARLIGFPAAERELRTYDIVFRRLLVRLYAADPGRWVVKGGVALLLRLDPNRASRDIDMTFMDAAGEHAVALDALTRATEIQLQPDDFFSFRVHPAPLTDRLGDDDTLHVTVDVHVGAQLYRTIGVDLARPAADVPSQVLRSFGTLTGVPAVDDLPPINVLHLALQIAEKTCAMFERHGDERKFSTHSRDLVDIAMIATQVECIDAAEVRRYLASEQQRRTGKGSLDGPLPAEFGLPTQQVAAWGATWQKATRGAPLSIDHALEVADRFLTPLLGGDDVTVWSAAEQRWQPDSA